MKRTTFILFLCLIAPMAYGQQLSVKTNLLYGATATLNIGAEVALGQKTTIDLTLGNNPWVWSDNKKWKHWLVMPEFRYYPCTRFSGHFFGLHTGYVEYNIGGIPLLYYPDARYYRYQGWATGAGISYGYQWRLDRRWNLEATIGCGIVYTEYGKYIQNHCGALIGNFNNLFFSPTKAGVTIVYHILK